MPMSLSFINIRLLTSIVCISMLIVSNSIQAKTKDKYEYSSNSLRVRLSPKVPQNIAAFYEGRGFSKPMIDTLKQQCFITIGIHNKSNDIIWLKASNWVFSTKAGNIKRRDRAYWKSVWKKMSIPLAHQSTFRWTLLPEELDFRSGEHEGGNIILPYTEQPFTLTAEFKTKADKSGELIKVIINDIRCVR